MLEAARQLGVDIASICGGRGLCGRCQILCGEGDFPKHGITSGAEHLSSVSATEREFNRLRKPLAPGGRLSCQALIRGDLIVDVPPSSQIHRQVVRKAADARSIEIDPVIRLYFVEVAEAKLSDFDEGADLTRLREALREQWGLDGLGICLPALAELQAALRRGHWSVTVAVRDDQEIIAVWAGYRDEGYGIAIDVGSTTVAAHLCALSSGEVISSDGMMNPQIRFGEDLMSRVSYAMLHPEGSRAMTLAVRGAINELIDRLCADSGVERDSILSLAVVCNPVMHHLLLGISPVELGGAPFALAVRGSVSVPARDFDVQINPGGVAYLLPCIAGHVGADAAGVILSEQPYERDEINLIVDIGTNAEIVLGNRQRLLACSSPTGPAFEGAQISCGQRAAPGAIERVRIDPTTLATRIKVIGSELWSDHPDFAQALPGGRVTGICGSGIIEAVGEMYLARVLTADGVIDGGRADPRGQLIRDGRTYSFVLYRGGEVESAAADTQRDEPDSDGTTHHATTVGDSGYDANDQRHAVRPGNQRGQSVGEPQMADTAGTGQEVSRMREETLISVTQNDVRQIQLAKAALYAGAKLLMDKLGVDRVERIRLAGAFGSHIDVKYAMVLGLIPDCPLNQATPAGNAAGTGARIALLNKAARSEIEAVVNQIERVETAVEPKFQEYFVDAMAIPHKRDPFPHLTTALPLAIGNAAKTDEAAKASANQRRRRRHRASHEGTGQSLRKQ